MGVLLGILVGLLLAASVLLVVRRLREGRDAVLGAPIAPPSPASGPAPAALSPAEPQATRTTSSKMPELDRLVDGLRKALADGELSDDEVQQLLPGAEIVREGDDVTVVQRTMTTTHHIEGPDGQTYTSVDDIPDPKLRDRVRRLLGE